MSVHDQTAVLHTLLRVYDKDIAPLAVEITAHLVPSVTNA